MEAVVSGDKCKPWKMMVSRREEEKMCVYIIKDSFAPVVCRLVDSLYSIYKKARTCVGEVSCVVVVGHASDIVVGGRPALQHGDGRLMKCN